MLVTLRIENFTIVKQLELDFASGMTAFTGETGAGKSIMIDALMLALGARTDASVIRRGEQKCDISAVFRLDDASEPTQWLEEHDIDCELGEIVLRRVLYQEGRSKSYINGQPFPRQKVKELSEMLVHIHGQHQHQTLMQHSAHRIQLDNYAGHQEILGKVAHLYREAQGIKNELDRLRQEENNHDRLALLQFQVDELTALAPQEGEMKRLADEHQRLHHANDYLQYSEEITDLLQADDKPNICQQLNQVLQRLQELPLQQVPVKNAKELINNAIIQCEEAFHEVQHFTKTVHLDPERLQDVEQRLGALHHAARKHHVDAGQLAAHTASLQQQLRDLQQADQRIAELLQHYQQRHQACQEAARLLRASRLTHAEKLGQDISAIIRQTGMPKGYVTVEISDLDKIQPHGMDKVEYKVCANPGMALDALSKIASGGELSRISLAIQMITAERGATPTLLFDEVDVGIGGATAALVGRLLRKLGERLQIFCVTHQPQVASAAHHHFVVEKHSDNDHTYSNIILLEHNDKVDEIARMLGGLTITDQTRTHAKELLETSQ